MTQIKNYPISMKANKTYNNNNNNNNNLNKYNKQDTDLMISQIFKTEKLSKNPKKKFYFNTKNNSPDSIPIPKKSHLQNTVMTQKEKSKEN